MRIEISHVTSYDYDGPVSYGLQELRLTPKSSQIQEVIRWETIVEGGDKQLHFDDHHQNRVDLVAFHKDTRTLTITNRGLVETSSGAGVVAEHTGFAPLWLYTRSTPNTQAGAGIENLAAELGSPGDSSEVIGALHRLSGRIGELVSYESGQTDATSTAEEALSEGRGVCQDHAQILVSAARLMGFPARYVSGYLMMDDRVEQDASHAWGEVWVDGLGWVGFDASNGISPDERYVRLATGLDYTEAAPVHGIRFGAAGESLAVSLQIQQQ